MDIIDYSKSFPNSMLAQGKGSNFLMISKLSEPLKRFDGKNGYYEVNYRWLSETCNEENDEAWCCVQGSDLIYLTKKEAKDIIQEIKNNSCNLFNHLHLF
tara:strand:- start:557 stop:856 length:300 start_codon:yes stop_codon:yes gene_type:complete